MTADDGSLVCPWCRSVNSSDDQAATRRRWWQLVRRVREGGVEWLRCVVCQHSTPLTLIEDRWPNLRAATNRPTPKEVIAGD